jgi:hypothetical protein
MRKSIVITVALALFLTGVVSLPWAAAQETAKQSEAQFKPNDSYKMEFTVNEMDSGKKINSRSYLMLLRAEPLPKWSDRQQLRVGSRVPVAVEADKFQYQNVGMNIDCRLMPTENGNVVLDTSWEYNGVEGEQGNHDMQRPVFRQVNSHVWAVVSLDRPTVISEMDDVASTHRYVFEVKVTKINP